MKEVGKRLRALRESLSQAKLAELLGITQSSLNRYENGQSTPTVEVFRKYADFFDISMDYIGHTENALKCKYNGGTPTFGFQIDADKHYQPDPITAPVVLDIFKMYDTGSTMKKIVDHLNGLGVTIVRGKPADRNSISGNLHNRRYIGKYRYHDIIERLDLSSLGGPDRRFQAFGLWDRRFFAVCFLRGAKEKGRPCGLPFLRFQGPLQGAGKMPCRQSEERPNRTNSQGEAQPAAAPSQGLSPASEASWEKMLRQSSSWARKRAAETRIPLPDRKVVKRPLATFQTTRTVLEAKSSCRVIRRKKPSPPASSTARNKAADRSIQRVWSRATVTESPSDSRVMARKGPSRILI